MLFGQVLFNSQSVPKNECFQVMFETRNAFQTNGFQVLFESRSATKKDGFQVLFETLSREAPPKEGWFSGTVKIHIEGHAPICENESFRP